MPFTTNRPLLETFIQALKTEDMPEHMRKLLCKDLRYLSDHTELFDVCVSTDTPFLESFFEGLKSGEMTSESCMALLECVALFFREKSLRLGKKRLSSVEQELLEYFETSGHWSPEQREDASTWYWQRLPLRVVEGVFQR